MELLVHLANPETCTPLTRAKIKEILKTHTSRTQELLMIQLVMWAGPRVSETIALAWEDVDLEQGTVIFRRSKVLRIPKHQERPGARQRRYREG